MVIWYGDNFSKYYKARSISLYKRRINKYEFNYKSRDYQVMLQQQTFDSWFNANLF